jgi:hypothetical protein
MINELIKKYQTLYNNGIFYLNKNEIINTIVKEKNVPNNYGIYIIYSFKNNFEEIIYIGKSGTMINDGSFKEQGIQKRLTKKQGNIVRKKYFQDVIYDNKFDKLKFLWIVTFDDKNKEIPSLSEAKMLQAYFNEYHRLPLLNKVA